MSGCRNSALSSKFIFASSASRSPDAVTMSGLISMSDASVAMKASKTCAITFAAFATAAPSSPRLNASPRAWNGSNPVAGSMCALKIRCGVSAATFSISMPPAGLTISTGRSAARSITRPRYSSRAICRPSSTSRRLTMRPSGPVWCVVRRMPIICVASASASTADVASFTPPPLPRPPAWICALTTTVPPSRRAMSPASDGVCATSPRGTGTPCLARMAFAWYS